jgi:phosphatidylinositol alpha-1,6-mannosyltransferase
MRILVVSQVFPPQTGGSGRWLWELYRRLSSSCVSVVAGDTPGAAAFDAGASVSIQRLPLDFAAQGALSAGGALKYFNAFRALNAVVSARHSDTLHCGKCVPEGVLATAIKWIRRVPFACYVHGEELGLAKTTREFGLFTRVVLRAAGTVIANSQHSRRLLESEWGVAPDKIVVMHPGVDVDRFVPAPVDREARMRLGWGGRRVILTVGALQKRKGQDMMIRALPAIRAACPDVLYSVIGAGWERPYLEQLAADNHVQDAVQFGGLTSEDDLLTRLQQCDLFALPNRRVGWDFEGFGIALIEAQACGRPVIAGNSGGAPETMVPGTTGELVDCDGPDALAGAAIGLLEDRSRRERMGRAAREWVVSRFAWSTLAGRAAVQFDVPTADDQAAS